MDTAEAPAFARGRGGRRGGYGDDSSDDEMPVDDGRTPGRKAGWKDAMTDDERNDLFLYDPKADDDDEKWVVENVKHASVRKAAKEAAAAKAAKAAAGEQPPAGEPLPLAPPPRHRSPARQAHHSPPGRRPQALPACRTDAGGGKAKGKKKGRVVAGIELPCVHPSPPPEAWCRAPVGLTGWLLTLWRSFSTGRQTPFSTAP